MKKIGFLTIGVLILTTNVTFGQFDSLFNVYIEKYDSAGWFNFKPNILQHGEVYQKYQQYSGDLLNTWVLKSDWVDSIIGMRHYRYQQKFRGLEVEGAEYSEHERDSFIVYSNCKIAFLNNDLNYIPSLSDTDALELVLNLFPNDSFAWLFPELEEELIEKYNDTLSTYYPKGKLLWALDNLDSLSFIISNGKYLLAWKFNIFCINPYYYKSFFVNAHNGEIFRVDDLLSYDGPANILTQGPETIDTRWKRGLFSGNILWTDNSGRNIHTKEYKPWKKWDNIQDYKDQDDIWDNDHQKGTTVHWMATQAWDYFSNPPFKRNGINNNGVNIRIEADALTFNNAYYKHDIDLNQDILTFGYFQSQYLATIDCIGHEYTHGISHYTADFGLSWEPASINESFSDIFGTMIERYVRPSSFDWIVLAEVSIANKYKRSLQNPESYYYHYEWDWLTLKDIEVIGQPKYYRGLRWESNGGDCHINAGVQNWWFYLLAMGGEGYNEQGYHYNIQGIGFDKAAIIAFYNLTNILQTTTQYIDARNGSCQAASDIYGYCSNEEIQTTNAWAAVGLGAPSLCPPSSIKKETEIASPKVFPNPTSTFLNITFNNLNGRKIEIYSINGELVIETTSNNLHDIVIDISKITHGLYFVKIIDSEQIFVTKFIKL